MPTPRRYRTIWLSDFHLGTSTCQTGFLLDFLRHNASEYLYLVGDIVDGWALRRSWYWDQAHNDILQTLLRRARNGTRVVYIPGNHDEFARDYFGLRFGGITIQQRAIHTTADGRQLLILHGDEFDGVVKYARWLALLGSSAYALTLRLNQWYNRARRAFDLPYWSLSAYLKSKTKKAVQYIGDYEQAVAREAHEEDVDGVVCGHIHHAELRPIGDVLYANTGDWVESCTALVEHFDGRLEILRWATVGREAVPTYQGDGQATAPPILVPHVLRRSA